MSRIDEMRRDRDSMLVHLEAALALSDKTGDVTAGYLIERALDEARAVTWPGKLNTPLPPKRR